MSKKNTKVFPCLILICLIFCANKIFGQSLPLISTDRPDQTESPVTVLKNHVQLEAGYMYESLQDFKAISIPSVLIRTGLTKNFEFRLETEYTMLRNSKINYKESGFSPVGLGFKFNVCEEKGWMPMTSILGHVIIPDLASEGFKGDHFTPAIIFTMENDLSEVFTLGYNIGAVLDVENSKPTFIYTVSTGISLSDRLGGFFELYGGLKEKADADNRFDTGLTYLVKNNLQLDISGGFAFSKNSPDYFGGFGISMRLPD